MLETVIAAIVAELFQLLIPLLQSQMDRPVVLTQSQPDLELTDEMDEQINTAVGAGIVPAAMP